MRRPHTFRLIEPVRATDHALGPDHASVTVVEYGDFECVRCRQAAPAVKLLLARFGQQVRFVFRHFPMEEIHAHALQAALAAECAGVQGEFWQMHDTLFATHAGLMPRELHEYAAQLGLDVPRFVAELNAGMYLHRVREHQRSALESGVLTTPALFVNGRIQDVSYGLHAIMDSVAEELRKQCLLVPQL